MEQHDLVRYAIERMEAICLPYMLVGSIAGSSYGEHRFTADIDFVIDLKPFGVKEFCCLFPDAEFYRDEQSIREATIGRYPFNVIHPTSGNKLDFMFSPDTAWGRGQLDRRRRIDVFPGLKGNVAAPEDVILGKLWYHDIGGSEKHLRDIAGILRVSGEYVDRTVVAEWAAKLGYLDTWNAVVAKVDGASASQ